MWKMDFVREELGPLRTKVVGKIGSSKFGETVYLFEDVEGNARTHFQTYINMWTERGFAVIIIYKNRRTAILPKGRI